MDRSVRFGSIASDSGIVLRLVAGKRFQILFHYPHRVTFHLSLTVLVHYRSATHIQPWKVVLPDSSNISRVSEYLGIRHGSSKVFAYGTITLYCPVFQPILLTSEFVTSAGASRNVWSRTPQHHISNAVSWHSYGLGCFPFRSPLLGESRLISFPEGTEMFHFPSFAWRRYVFTTP